MVWRCYDALMRTTLNLDPDILEVARAIARAEGRGLGVVLSDLARRGLAPAHPPIDDDSGFPVFRVRPGAPPITEEIVAAARDEP